MSPTINVRFSVGLAAFVYHDRHSNKPQALDDCYANSDSGSGGGHSGFYSVEDNLRRVSQVECIGFDIPRVSMSKCKFYMSNRIKSLYLHAMIAEKPLINIFQ